MKGDAVSPRIWPHSETPREYLKSTHELGTSVGAARQVPRPHPVSKLTDNWPCTERNATLSKTEQITETTEVARNNI